MKYLHDPDACRHTIPKLLIVSTAPKSTFHVAAGGIVVAAAHLDASDIESLSTALEAVYGDVRSVK
jgi:hypothetical protein